MTDLEKFVELYKSFGIECKVNDCEVERARYDSKSEFRKGYFIELNGGLEYGEATHSEKFDGYGGFYSSIYFDEGGKFLGQGFWE